MIVWKRWNYTLGAMAKKVGLQQLVRDIANETLENQLPFVHSIAGKTTENKTEIKNLNQISGVLLAIAEMF